jgi:periplasmic divalent cation tolerance protein
LSADYSILVTTIDSGEKAREIARTALAARLAACVQIFPIQSHYEWNGEMREDAEILIQMKIRSRDYAELAALVRRLHSYDLPEILRIDIAEGDTAYLDWIAKTTRREGGACS